METFKGLVSAQVNARKDFPSVKSEKLKVIRKNTEVTISHAVIGEKYMDSKIWYVLDNNCFVWSGAISTTSAIPLIEKKLIVTADDIGIVHEVDVGAQLALYHGWINSIAVLVNKPNDVNGENLRSFVESLKKYSRKGTSENLFETSLIGLHFTITSGSPIVDPETVPALVDEKNHFLGFQKFSREYEKPEVVEQVKIEFEAQYQKFKNIFGREPDHLTSHHDIHTFNKPLFCFFHNWSVEKGIPIRSHRFLPSIKRFMYDAIAMSPSRVDLPSIDRMNRWESEIRKEPSEGPEHTYVGHYGPIPPFGINNYDTAVNKKHKRLRKWMRDFLISKDSKREILIHLMKSGFRDQRDFKKSYAYLEAEYPGMEVNYFDGRVAEYLSLQRNSLWKPDSSFILVARS
ncbi:YdjC-like protein [Algoriphagus locisalis]|uniref:YdjC-like protein n=1 Tax=Algoriphagus locisalis TaxID=305507 RepID=A0A1I6YWN3_9BACT|nr:ChbG/HpnK family deacetylase [Algoriphagus locisalis]SFT54836.1 YdjC-like protein [Algoriphagus locisalis]